MSTIASQITSLTIVHSTVYSGADQRKHQSSASLAFVREIHRGPVNSPHKGPVTRKMSPFDDVIMPYVNTIYIGLWMQFWSYIHKTYLNIQIIHTYMHTLFGIVFIHIYTSLYHNYVYFMKDVSTNFPGNAPNTIHVSLNKAMGQLVLKVCNDISFANLISVIHTALIMYNIWHRTEMGDAKLLRKWHPPRQWIMSRI